jgi:hypothetical protein
VAVAGLLILGLLLLRRESAPPAAAPTAQPGSLLLVAGADTSTGHGRMFRFDPASIGFSCQQTFYFSYAGPGPGGPQGDARCPITTGARYAKADTGRPLSELASSFSGQVAPLPAPVTVITHSTGSAIAWSALANAPATQVRQLVMLAPLSDPLGYPPKGHIGPNVVGAAGTRLALELGERVGFSSFDIDDPLATELLGAPDALRRLHARGLPPDVRSLAVVAPLDGPLFGPGHPFPRTPEVCPSKGGHSVVVTDAATATAVRDFIAGRPVMPCRPWPPWAGLIAAGFRAPDP